MCVCMYVCMCVCMCVNMRAGAYSTISVQRCDHTTPAAPELGQGSCMNTVPKATNLILSCHMILVPLS